MHPGGGNGLAFSTKCPDAGAQQRMESDNTVSVTASPLLSRPAPHCPRHAPGSCLHARRMMLPQGDATSPNVTPPAAAVGFYGPWYLSERNN